MIQIEQNQKTFSIGRQNEKSLHAALREWCARPGDQFEVKIENYIIDIVRDELLIEIQTRNFSALKNKLKNLVRQHPVQLIFPIATEKWIVTLDGNNNLVQRRKSPKNGRAIDIFHELVRFPELMTEENFNLVVVYVQLEEIRKNDGKGSWRRKGISQLDQKLLSIIDHKIYAKPADFLSFLPTNIPNQFSNFLLAQTMKIPVAKIRRMTYCLRKMDVISVVGKEGNLLIFQINTMAKEGI